MHKVAASCGLQLPEQKRAQGTRQLHLLQEKQGGIDIVDAGKDEMEDRRCGARSVPRATGPEVQLKKRGMANSNLIFYNFILIILSKTQL